MGVSKVVYGDDTLVDLTEDTVTPTSLTLGATAHGANGEPIVGEYQYTLPVASPTTRGGARIKPDSGLEITDTDNLQVRLALESDGTVRGGIAELQAKGHAKQVSTTGKNLLPITVTSLTLNGVAFTVNSDGSVTANGTASADASLPVYTFDFTGGTTYTLSGCPTGGSTTTYDLNIGGGNPDWGSGRVYTPSSNNQSEVRVRIRSGVTVSNLTFYPMLELGSVATEYEPYTGGAPSPSPEFPQTIEVVRGRNLLDESQYEHYDIYSADGHLAANANANCIFAEIEQGEAYCVTRTSEGTSTYFYYGFFSDMPQSSSVALKYGAITTPLITAPSGAKYVGVFFGQGKSVEPQLTLGSTPQPYVPYGHVGMEVESAKNIFSGNDVMLKTPIPSGTVLVASATTSAVVRYFRQDKSQINYWTLRQQATDGRYYRAFELSEDAYYFNFNTGTDWQIEVADNLSSVPTSYEPHILFTAPIPLPSRGWVAGLPYGTADSLRLDGAGKCEWTLPTGEVVLDGSENWGFNTTAGKSFAFSPLQNSADIEAQASLSKLLVDKFIVSLAQTGETAYQGGHNLIIFTGDTYNPTSAAEAKAWAESNPITVLYPLATPVTEDCGYVEDWPTDLPEGCVVSCPELDAVGVKYFIDSAVTELARQWYARANSEYADRITALEQAVAELATS